ncbi:MAG TPA: hypothetical protein VN317_03360 [Candidatus Methanoperedens sp.]|nr:hypothetical protein [Candidatus Methanoperedens sp.]
MKKFSLAAGLSLLALFGALAAVAEAAVPLRQVPVTIATTLLPGRIFTFKFNLYTASSGGTKVWGPGSAKLTVAADKTIAYTLGAMPAFGPAVDFTQQMWLQVTGGGKTWRVPLGAAPYALQSLSAAADSITTVQILDGSITAADIQDGSGSGLDADLLDNQHASDFLTVGAQESVTSDMIANGTIKDEDIDAAAAIADSKLAQIATPGMVADSALSANVDLLDWSQTVTGVKTFNPAGGTVPFAVDAARNGRVANLNADLLDGDHGSAFQKKYGRVAVVAKGGGDYDDPFTAMATEALAEWCPSPTADSPCLLKIMPGVYDIGADNSIQMQSYVDIEGSGEKTTKIKGSVGDAVPATAGLVYGADNAELRFLTVENAAARTYVIAFRTHLSSSPSLLHVTAIASGASLQSVAIVCNAPATMTHVTALSKGGGTDSHGIRIVTAAVTIRDSTAEASGGAAGNYGISLVGSSTAAMTNVEASASGGTDSFGIHLPSPTKAVMTRVSTGAKDATNTNKGIFLGTSVEAVMTDVTATGSGGTASYGIYNSQGLPVMSNVVASAKDGTSNYGLYNYATSGTYTVFADRSSFEGSTASVYNSNAGFTVVLGASKLSGGLPSTGTGTWSCASSYKVEGAAYVPLNATCQ